MSWRYGATGSGHEIGSGLLRKRGSFLLPLRGSIVPGVRMGMSRSGATTASAGASPICGYGGRATRVGPRRAWTPPRRCESHTPTRGPPTGDYVHKPRPWNCGHGVAAGAATEHRCSARHDLQSRVGSTADESQRRRRRVLQADTEAHRTHTQSSK